MRCLCRRLHWSRRLAGGSLGLEAADASGRAGCPRVAAATRSMRSFVRSSMRGPHARTARSREHLLRRVTFDLTGLPPTPAEIDAFVTDTSPDAWEKVVDRLLASPALRRALGPALARPGPLRRHQRLRARRAPARRLAVPRLRHPLVQRRQAVRPLRPRAARRRRAVPRRPRRPDRHRVQPARPGHDRRRRPGASGGRTRSTT